MYFVDGGIYGKYGISMVHLLHLPIHVWYIYLHDWIIFFGPMLGFICRHHRASGIGWLMKKEELETRPLATGNDRLYSKPGNFDNHVPEIFRKCALW